MPGGTEKTFFVLCVRGNPRYGVNDFQDNGDNTISDRATGLMWAKPDSGKGMNWQAALAWVQAKNAENYLRPRRLAAAQRQGVAEHRRLSTLARYDPFRGDRSALHLHADYQRGGPGRLSLLLDRHDPRHGGRPRGSLHRVWQGLGLHGGVARRPRRGLPAQRSQGRRRGGLSASATVRRAMRFALPTMSARAKHRSPVRPAWSRPT